MTACIAIVDDDAAVRSSLASVLSTYGYETRKFASVREAIGELSRIQWDCILLDVRMPDLDGLSALKLLKSSATTMPVIMITGHGDIPMAVQAIKLGAVDFIEKPIVDEVLVQSIGTALESSKRNAQHEAVSKEVRDRYATLTAREQDVAALVVDGCSSAAIASRLKISVRTVDHHRASILAKMQATSFPQLLKYLLFVLR